MKIYCAHASDFDFRQEFYAPLANIGGHDYIFPHDGTAFRSREVIQSCDLVVAEVSRPSTGMGIELGWADTAGIPIIAVYRKNCVPSSSIGFIAHSSIVYESPDDMASQLRRALHVDSA